MLHFRLRSLFGLAALASATCLHAHAATRTIIVKEQLHQEYGRELLSTPFSAGTEECTPGSFRLTGPKGPVAVQLSDVQFRTPKKQHVKTATIWFVVEKLYPLTTHQYTLTFGQKQAAPLTTDLTVNMEDDVVKLSTSSLGVRLPVGKGAGGKNTPAPLLGMRLKRNAWSGKSEWTGQARITGWSAEVTDRGPVFARCISQYTISEEATVTFVATVIAGDSAVRWQMNVTGDRPETLVRFALPAVPGVKQAALPKGYGQWARDRKKAVGNQEAGFVALSPNTSLVNIFADNPHRVVLSAGDISLELMSRDPGAWVKPGPPHSYGPTGLDSWNLDMIGEMWNGWQRKAMPVQYAGNGAVSLVASLVQGRRLWSVSAGPPAVGDSLRKVRGMVLDWPSTSKHPHLFMDMPAIKDVWRRAQSDPALDKTLHGRWAAAALKVMRKPAGKRTTKEVAAVVNTLRQQLAKMGHFDVMRGAIGAAGLYDALIDSDLISSSDRALFRAQMAYLAYLMADPMCWSAEHGYGSGNPNMHCSYTLSLGVIACVLKEHPNAKEWSDYATGWLHEWLTDEVGANGEWLPEGSHYGLVSLGPQQAYAIAAERAGYHDFTADARLKSETLFFAKMHAPPDVQRNNKRVTGSWGRGTSNDRLAICGIAARMTSQKDPEYARVMQWMWARTGYPGGVGDNRLGGYEPYYLARNVPEAAPVWGSELFPGLGALLRADFNTPHESYVNVLACVDSQRNLDVWVPGVGDIAQWVGLGKPLSTCFTFKTGYGERHELLAEGVRLARNYAPGDSLNPFGYYTKTHFDSFAAMPKADYVRTRIVNTHADKRGWTPPKMPAYPKVTPAKSHKLDWTRQILFLKGTGPAYLVIRDTTTGGEPTAWQFWTLSETIVTPEKAANTKAVSAHAPGKTVVDARELPKSNRYTALGQFGVDVEYFIAAPARSPRHTLRYGGEYRRVPEYQDALLLQQPGDGSYYVTVFPRTRKAKPPTFSHVAAGKVIKVAMAAGTDHAFLATRKTTATAGDISFDGTSGAVRRRNGLTSLILGAAGKVTAGANTLEAPFAAELSIGAKGPTLHLPPQCPGGEVTVTASGRIVHVPVPQGASTHPIP